MFFASPVQNLTLPRAKVAYIPLFRAILGLFWPFLAFFGLLDVNLGVKSSV